MITNGSLQAFNFLARHHVQAGARIFVEAPCYDRSLQILRRLGAEVESIPLSDDGSTRRARAGARGHERPEPRLHDSDLPEPERPDALGAEPPPPARACPRTWRDRSSRTTRTASFASAGRACRGSSSSPAATASCSCPPFRRPWRPGIRVGYAILPEELMGAMQTLVFENYVSPVMFVEATLHEFVSRGRFDPNVEAIQEALRVRRDAMITALAREMPEGTTWNEPDGGYFLWVDLPGGLSAESLLAQADEVGVAFIKGPDFFFHGGGESAHAPRVLVRAARGDRRGHRAARPARARGARRSRRDPTRVRDGPGSTSSTASATVTSTRSRSGSRSGSRRSGSTPMARARRAGTSSRSTTSSAPGRGGHEELYVVLAGHAIFAVGGEELDGAGGHARLRPRPGDPTRRDAVEPDTTVLVVGGTVGEGLRALPLGGVARGAPALRGEGLRPRPS